jgi:diketogulonate reductase-like aldo/keto reductase
MAQRRIAGDPTRELADGGSMPMLGLGVGLIENDLECVDAVRWAIGLGYRHIDTAQIYRNEEAVGRGLRASGIPRDEVFITTKFFPQYTDPVAELERSLERLGVECVDLYLVHWPEGGATWAWPAMEEAQKAGYARSIGVSNFGVDELGELLAVATMPPVVNQVEFNPYAYREALLVACDGHGIVLEAYSPLGRGEHLSSEAVSKIARRLRRTPAQVLLRWCIERRVPVIPKSMHRARIAENAQLFDFALSAEDVAELDVLDLTGLAGHAVENPNW